MTSTVSTTIELWQAIATSTGDIFQSSMPFFSLMFGVVALIFVMALLIKAFRSSMNEITK